MLSKKSLTFKPKLFHLGILRLVLEKAIAMFEISTLKFLLKNEFLTIIINISIGSALLKGPRFTFSEGPGLGPACFIKYVIWSCSFKKRKKSNEGLLFWICILVL